jgi:hypothetical protein
MNCIPILDRAASRPFPSVQLLAKTDHVQPYKANNTACCPVSRQSQEPNILIYESRKLCSSSKPTFPLEKETHGLSWPALAGASCGDISIYEPLQEGPFTFYLFTSDKPTIELLI